jgi:excinuclease ABC subunit C
MINEITSILKGDIKVLQENLLAEMAEKASKMDFEAAQEIKEKYKLIENFRLRSEVVSSSMTNLDVFSIESDEKSAFINFLHITNGCITQAFTIEYSKKLDESDEELISMGIVELRERFKSNAKEIILPFVVDLPVEGVTVTVPQKGEKARLLALSKLNVKQYRSSLQRVIPRFTGYFDVYFH